MPEQLLVHALTTEARVKNRLGITVAGHDTLFQRLINGVTDFIESQCNLRFQFDTHTNEEYVIESGTQKFIFLKDAPIDIAPDAVINFQYRAGTPSNPSWTNLLADEWEIENRIAGIIRIYTRFAKGTRLRLTYKAGYKINFANAGDSLSHTLPHDISDLAERLVTRWFKRREAEGKASDSFEGGTVSWSQELTKEDKETIGRYRREPSFV